MAVRSIIDDFIEYITQLIQQYGWTLVFFALSLYLLRNHISKLRASISLSQANNPRRREVFDSEARRVRSRQQKEILLKSSEERKR